MDSYYITTSKPVPCPKCEKGTMSIEFGGPTGYKLECDSCDHSFPVTVGKSGDK